jgi:hypothetical protein
MVYKGLAQNGNLQISRQIERTHNKKSILYNDNINFFNYLGFDLTENETKQD